MEEKAHAAAESFEPIQIFGKTVLFTNMRDKRSTVPNDLYVYDVRDEECMGDRIYC